MSVETIDRTLLPLFRGGASPSVMTEEVVAALFKTETNNEAVRIIAIRERPDKPHLVLFIIGESGTDTSLNHEPSTARHGHGLLGGVL